MEKEDIVKYWIESSDSDFQVMESLFDKEHYVWTLFLGHLVVEKLLKAYHVRNVGVDYPRIHNLLEIAHKAALELSEEQKLVMSELSTLISGLDILIIRIGFKRKPIANIRKYNLTKYGKSENGY